LLYITGSYASVVYIISTVDLNVHLEDLLDHILYLFYVRIFTVSIKGFNFKKSREDSHFFINVTAALLKLQVNDEEIMSTPAAVLLKPRASIIALHASFLNFFYISAKSGLDIEIKSMLNLCDLKILEYS
jgi:hypothetical protein